jgi:2-polyprenyl-6-methoxyphenol hydroxylase-like FAD-dependent oxidoreductase
MPFRIAIVGSGPVGLSAAHDLARLGYSVTIFEAASVPGGMLTLGIPEYRLPRNIVESQIREILDSAQALAPDEIRDARLAPSREVSQPAEAGCQCAARAEFSV